MKIKTGSLVRARRITVKPGNLVRSKWLAANIIGIVESVDEKHLRESLCNVMWFGTIFKEGMLMTKEYELDLILISNGSNDEEKP